MQEPSTPEAYKQILEAALLSASVPRPVSVLRRLFVEDPGPDMVRKLLDELREALRQVQANAGNRDAPRTVDSDAEKS